MIIKNYLKNPFKYCILSLANHNLLFWLPDKAYLKLMFRAHMGKRLDLRTPKTFNEKLQWLKLYDRRPIYTTMVDKYAVKKYVADIIGAEYIIPTLGVWDCFDDIDFSALPDRFVLKCTHDSGGLVICRDKDKLDMDKAREKITRALGRNYYLRSREWPYKNVKPRVIAEAYMEDESETELKDYKVFNFMGIPQMVQLDFNRFSGHKRNLYNTDWIKLNVDYKYVGDPDLFKDRPAALEQMLGLARTLSVGIPFVRTDFYVIHDKVFFGEFTFFPEGGLGQFSDEKADAEFGQLLQFNS